MQRPARADIEKWVEPGGVMEVSCESKVIRGERLPSLPDEILHQHSEEREVYLRRKKSILTQARSKRYIGLSCLVVLVFVAVILFFVCVQVFHSLINLILLICADYSDTQDSILDFAR